MTLRELWCRLTGLLRRQDPDPDLEDEIANHLELAKADYLRRGMSEAEARRLAAVKFGTVSGAKEHVWEQRRMPGIGALLQDAQYAVRGMRKSPGFTLTTIATLSLGIGLCCVMYSALTGILLRPLPCHPKIGTGRRPHGSESSKDRKCCKTGERPIKQTSRRIPAQSQT